MIRIQLPPAEVQRFLPRRIDLTQVFLGYFCTGDEAQLADLAHRQWTIWKTPTTDPGTVYDYPAWLCFPDPPGFSIEFFAFRPDSVQAGGHSIHSVQTPATVVSLSPVL